MLETLNGIQIRLVLLGREALKRDDDIKLLLRRRRDDSLLWTLDGSVVPELADKEIEMRAAYHL